mgnify:CR=1 FL=1
MLCPGSSAGQSRSAASDKRRFRRLPSKIAAEMSAVLVGSSPQPLAGAGVVRGESGGKLLREATGTDGSARSDLHAFRRCQRAARRFRYRGLLNWRQPSTSRTARKGWLPKQPLPAPTSCHPQHGLVDGDGLCATAQIPESRRRSHRLAIPEPLQLVARASDVPAICRPSFCPGTPRAPLLTQCAPI